MATKRKRPNTGDCVEQPVARRPRTGEQLVEDLKEGLDETIDLTRRVTSLNRLSKDQLVATIIRQQQQLKTMSETKIPAPIAAPQLRPAPTLASPPGLAIPTPVTFDRPRIWFKTRIMSCNAPAYVFDIHPVKVGLPPPPRHDVWMGENASAAMLPQILRQIMFHQFVSFDTAEAKFPILQQFREQVLDPFNAQTGRPGFDLLYTTNYPCPDEKAYAIIKQVRADIQKGLSLAEACRFGKNVSPNQERKSGTFNADAPILSIEEPGRTRIQRIKSSASLPDVPVPQFAPQIQIHYQIVETKIMFQKYIRSTGVTQASIMATNVSIWRRRTKYDGAYRSFQRAALEFAKDGAHSLGFQDSVCVF